jgi:hypothetical protein
MLAAAAAALLNIGLLGGVITTYVQNMLTYCLLILWSLFFGQNVSTIDHVLSAVESFEGVKSTDVSIPTSLVYHNDWVIKEINQRLSK